MSKKKTLADLMDNDFFIDFDNTEEKAKRQQLAESLKKKSTLTESAEENVKEPDNAVVDCKVNKVIAHCEDEKPVDCLGEKKPLDKPLTEEPNKMTADELKDKYGTDDVDLINAGREEKDRVELKETRSAADIRTEIERLQKELAEAEAAEKKQ